MHSTSHYSTRRDSVIAFTGRCLVTVPHNVDSSHVLTLLLAGYRLTKENSLPQV
jgi:hypothetical protein